MSRILCFFCTALVWLVYILGHCMPTYSQNCRKTLQFKHKTRTFATCISLHVQGATLAWSVDPHNHIANISFSGSAPSSSGWVGWGINPTELAMSGTSSFIAFTAPNGSNLLPYKLTDDTLAYNPLVCTPVDFVVLDQDVHISGPTISMFISLKLRPNQTVLNHVWNRGTSVTQFQPGPHEMSGDGVLGLRAINMFSGSISAQSGSWRQTLKNKHGILNTIAWGILLPLGVMCGRYIRPFTNAAWFYGHIAFQCTGYAIGVAGWATGMELGNAKVVNYHKHGQIGLALFVISTLQVMALFLRPDKNHKFRKYWNIYHHAVGYTLIILGISNIMEGFEILSPEKKWRKALYSILGTLGVISIILEIVIWITYIRRKRLHAEKSHSMDSTSGRTAETDL